MRILFIYTGGTMGMVPSDTGLVPSLGIVEDCLHSLYATGEVTGTRALMKADPLIDSSAIEPSHWNWIGQTIEARYADFDAFVVVHGTDTLAYTACALTFGLEGLGKPVIVTGAMLPLGETGSDGRRNLRDAIITAGQAPAGVWVQFAGKRMHGARVRKSHSSALDSFHDAETSAPPRHMATQFQWRNFSAFNVPVVTFVPGMDGSILRLCAEHADGVVLRCYGAGTVPDLQDLSCAIDTARSTQKPITAISQCAQGGVALGKYASSAGLMSKGVVDGKGATTTAAYVKTLFALSQRQNIADIPAYLAKPICGELG